MNSPPNDVRYFVHKRLIGAAIGLIPGASTALAIGQSLLAPAPAGTVRGASALVKRGGALINLGLTDARRREITRAMQAATARGDTATASAFLRELGTQGALAARAALSNLGLTDARRREITRAMQAATARGDTATASAFLRELGTQGTLRPPSVPPPNPVRQAVIQAKPMEIVRLPPRPRARIPQVFPVLEEIPMIQDKLRGLLKPAPAPCPPGSFPSPAGCVDPSAILPGGDPLFGAGAPVMGRYGPAYRGTSRLIQRTTCLPGDLVGSDGLCYNRKTITNKERMWPKGRQPLLTGGEMRAISIAARAAGKFERTQKRLQKLGMIKKPASGRRQIAPRVPPHQHQITAGG